MMDPEDREWLKARALNVVGHELRTPASTVRGMAEVLATTDDPATVAELIPALLRNARRLEQLVDDLLAATGVETALPAGPPAAVDLIAAARAVWGTGPGLETAAPGGRQAERAGGPAGAPRRAPAAALARPESVHRILGAVLDNARRYGQLPVSVEVEVLGGCVRLVVDSPGPEVPPEDVRMALEPFWRGERAVTTGPGLGVGLAVARALAEHEHGRLWVAARPAGGLLTFLELPSS